MVHEICSVDRKKKKKKKERKNARETGHIRLQRMCNKKPGGALVLLDVFKSWIFIEKTQTRFWVVFQD